MADTTSNNQDKMVVDEPSTHAPATGGVNGAEDDGKKVFFGNLSYSTTAEDLKEFLTGGGGNIVSIDLPKKFGSKPAGYAFVVYGSEEEAKGAVEKLEGKKLGDRDIGVQIAKPFAEQQAIRAEKLKAKKEALREKRKNKKVVGGAQGDIEENTVEATTTTGGGETTEGESVKKPKKKKAKKPARRLPEEGEDAPAEDDSNTAAAPLTEINANETVAAAPAARTKKPRRGPKKNAAGDAPVNDEAAEEARIDKELQQDNNEGVEGEEENVKGKRGARRGEPRGPREPKWIQTDVPSPTTIFVANLPFTVDDAALSELFTNLGIHVKTASIVRKPRFSPKVVPRSKGFGFVEVADEKAQKEALEKLAGHMIGDRQLTVKVANLREPIVKEGEGEGEAHARADSGVEISS